MDKNTIETLKAFGTFAAVIGGIIGLASIMPEEDPKARKRRLKREADERKRRQIRAKEFRNSQAAPDQWSVINDVVSVMTEGKRSSHSITQELIAIESDEQTVNLYRAYRNEGVEFTYPQRERIKMSMGSLRWLI